MIELAPIREVLGNRFISLARSDLAVALFGACECVQANFGVEVTAIPQDRAGVLATLSDGRRERFDLVIGADGASSSANVFQFLL